MQHPEDDTAVNAAVTMQRRLLGDEARSWRLCVATMTMSERAKRGGEITWYATNGEHKGKVNSPQLQSIHKRFMPVPVAWETSK
jgi:hypothetical protein